MEPPDNHDPSAVDEIANDLATRFGASLTPALREAIAREAIDSFRDAPVQSFVTILAQRLAVEIATQRLYAA